RPDCCWDCQGTEHRERGTGGCLAEARAVARTSPVPRPLFSVPFFGHGRVRESAPRGEATVDGADPGARALAGALAGGAVRPRALRGARRRRAALLSAA